MKAKPVDQDARRDPGTALRDRVQPHPRHAFPNAYFEKDNDARTGSKGDYIFRDSDEAGTEIVSIMFEMKNENDSTATKKRTKTS